MQEKIDPRSELFRETDQSYQRFLNFLGTLTPEKWHTPTDDAGWTVKDHVIHCAFWSGSLIAVIDKQPRWVAMGVPFEIWETIAQDYDRINEVIWQQNRHLTEEEVRSAFTDAYLNLKERVWQLTLEELERPYSHYQELAENQTYPLYAYVRGNTGDHFDEHLSYIRLILGETKQNDG